MGMKPMRIPAIFMNISLKDLKIDCRTDEYCPIRPVAMPQRTARTISCGMSSFRNGFMKFEGAMLISISLMEKDAPAPLAAVAVTAEDRASDPGLNR